MPKNHLTINTMTRKDIDIAIEWAAIEGWNPGRHDADCYFTADSSGFFIGLVDDEPVATISAIRYGESFGFVGFYIVKPEYRGRGYGLQIWNAAMQYLEGRTIGLDGVPAQQDNYKKSGFRLAYRNIRYQGTGGGPSSENREITKLSALPFEMIDAYDRAFFPADRSRFVQSWIRQPGSQALGILKAERLAGYGVIRSCRSGYKIGPLYADTPELAESLYSALISGIKPDESIFLDVPEVNRAAVALAECHQMTVSFETARMYTGDAPELPLHRIFGVTSFEIG